MAKLRLTLGCGPYDRMQPLADGTVQAEGIEIDYQAVSPPQLIFARMVHEKAYDAAEMSLCFYLASRAKGGFPFTAIPVFPSRVFRHGHIFVSSKAGIETPRDLNGKRIGLQEYRQSAAVWVRGILRDEYGVDTASITWVEGGINAPRAHDPVMDLRPEFAGGKLAIEQSGEGTTHSDALANGGIDALLGARVPESLKESGEVARLIPDYRAAERAYYEKTGIFPIMHTLVIRDDILAAHPWVAESLFKAFQQSKAECLKRMRFSGAMRYMVPWLFADLDEMDALMGPDPWPYGLEPNRVTLETLMRYLIEDGLMAGPIGLEEIFAPIVAWQE